MRRGSLSGLLILILCLLGGVLLLLPGRPDAPRGLPGLSAGTAGTGAEGRHSGRIVLAAEGKGAGINREPMIYEKAEAVRPPGDEGVLLTFNETVGAMLALALITLLVCLTVRKKRKRGITRSLPRGRSYRR